MRRDQGAAPGTPDEQAPAGIHRFPRPCKAENGGDVWQEREHRRAGRFGRFLGLCGIRYTRYAVSVRNYIQARFECRLKNVRNSDILGRG